MNDMIGELTGKEAKEYMDGITKLLPSEFTHHGSPDAVKVITEEFKLNLPEVYSDKKIATPNEDKK